LEIWEGTVRWSLETLEGKALAAGTAAVKAAPQAATQVMALDFAEQISEDNRRDLVFVAELWQGESRLALRVATFVPVKHLALKAPRVATNVRGDSHSLSIDLMSDTLAMIVELSLGDEDVVFSDNYFSLPAGRAVTVTCPLPNGWTLGEAQAALTVRSIYDSYTIGK